MTPAYLLSADRLAVRGVRHQWDTVRSVSDGTLVWTRPTLHPWRSLDYFAETIAELEDPRVNTYVDGKLHRSYLLMARNDLRRIADSLEELVKLYRERSDKPPDLAALSGLLNGNDSKDGGNGSFDLAGMLALLGGNNGR